MSAANPPKSPARSHRFSHRGFHPLRENQNDMTSNDATIDIPLEAVSPSPSGQRNNSSTPINMDTNEKGGDTAYAGRRKMKNVTSKGEATGHVGYDGEEDTITRLGKIYSKILNFSIVTRYFIYVSPLALAIAVPIIVGATAAKDAKIGGVRIVWFFTWIEIVWLSIWVSKIVAHFLPKIFVSLAGVVSSGVRKYALVIQALEFPLSLVGWAVTSLATFIPLMLHNPDIQREADAQEAAGQTRTADSVQTWEKVVRHLLAAATVSACVFLVEKFVIQLISINYHRKQFNARIKENKRNIYLLSLLYDASRALFPPYGPEFQEEDYIITDVLTINLGLKKKGHYRSGSATPMRLLQNVGRVGDKVTSAFGNIASEITGKQILNPDAAHSIVTSALEKTRSSEALARRLWMSFVVEGRNALYQEDIVEVLGAGREQEAEEAFRALDKDGNGDISLEEMILMVTEIGRDRKSVHTSMHDIDQAINVLDNLLVVVVFVATIFIIISFLNTSFVTTLATAGTALLSLSFVFSVTCQEVLGSCIFVFVKHPYDVGDRVDLGTDQLTVEHISLLFTVFKRVTNGRTVQIPNNILNSLWIENTSRSLAMREQIPVYIDFATSFEDIQALKAEIENFVRDKENSRDFFPDVEVEVRSIASMDKLELNLEVRHKSNWGNETLRTMRRSKLMCALVQAIRKVPIAGPGGSDAALGDAGKPSYSVSISASEAQERREAYLADKESKRLIPTKKPSEVPKEDAHSTGVDLLGNNLNPENQAINSLIRSRSIAHDQARDAAWQARDDASSISGRPSMDAKDREGIESALRREATKGKRKAGPVSPLSPSVPTISEPSGQYQYYDYAGSPPSQQSQIQRQLSVQQQQQRLGTPTDTAYYGASSHPVTQQWSQTSQHSGQPAQRWAAQHQQAQQAQQAQAQQQFQAAALQLQAQNQYLQSQQSQGQSGQGQSQQDNRQSDDPYSPQSETGQQ